MERFNSEGYAEFGGVVDFDVVVEVGSVGFGPTDEVVDWIGTREFNPAGLFGLVSAHSPIDLRSKSQYILS